MPLFRTLIAVTLIRPHRIVRLLALLAVSVLIALLFYLGQKPMASGFVKAPWDKLMHLGVYGGLAVLFWIVSGARSVSLVLASVAVVGFLDEFVQLYTPGRQAGFGDWLADMIGAGLALAMIRLISGWATRTGPDASTPSKLPIGPAGHGL